MSDILTGKVVGSEVSTVANGQLKVTKLQVQTPEGGVHLMQMLSSAGEDTTPNIGCRVAFIRSAGVNLVVATSDTLAPSTAVGEKEFYSSSGTQKSARLKLKANGKIFAASQSGGVNLATALTNLINGIQGATATDPTSGALPLADATGKIALALTQLGVLLDSTP